MAKPPKKPARRRTYADRMSYQPKGKRGGKRSLKAPLALLGLLILLGGIGYAVVFSPLFAVGSVKVSGSQKVPAADVNRVALQAAEMRFGPLVSESLAVASPSKLEAALKREFPDLDAATVKKRWPQTLDIALSERKTTLLWKSGERYYLIDRQGTAYAASEPQEGAVTVEDTTGLGVEVGKPVAGAGFIKVIEEIKAGMDAAGQPVTTFRIPETTFEVQAVTGGGYYALYDTTRPVASQVQALAAAVAQQKPREYADVRVPGRVYVK